MLDLKEQNIEALVRGSLYSNITEKAYPEKLKDFLFWWGELLLLILLL